MPTPPHSATSTSLKPQGVSCEAGYLLAPPNEVSDENSEHHTTTITTITTAVEVNNDDMMLQQEESTRSFCQLWHNTFLYIPYLVLVSVSGILIRPILPGMMKEFFGSDRLAAEVVSYIAGFFAFVGLFTASGYGKLMDTIGRKPFFVIAPLFQNLIPTVLLLIFPNVPVLYTIGFYMGKLIQSSFLTAYISDHYSTGMRVKVFAVMYATGNLSAFCGIFVSVLTNTMCMVVSIACSSAAIVYAFFFIKESLPSSSPKKPVTCAALCEDGALSAMSYLLAKSKLRRALTCIVACVVFAQVGTQDIYMYYLNERVGFKKSDNGILFAEIGVLMPIILLVVLPILSKRLSPTVIIVICLTALAVEQTFVAVIWAVWPVFAIIIPLVCLSAIGSPVVVALMSNSGSVSDQGRRLTCRPLWIFATPSALSCLAPCTETYHPLWASYHLPSLLCSASQLCTSHHAFPN